MTEEEIKSVKAKVEKLYGCEFNLSYGKENKVISWETTLNDIKFKAQSSSPDYEKLYAWGVFSFSSSPDEVNALFDIIKNSEAKDGNVRLEVYEEILMHKDIIGRKTQ